MTRSKPLLLRPAMDPMPRMAKRSLFEAATLLALLVSWVQTAYQWPALVVEYGEGQALFMAASGTVVGLLLLLGVSRLRSRLAALLFLFTYFFALAIVLFDLTNDYSRSPAYAIGLVSMVLDSVGAWLVLRWLSGRDAVDAR